MWRLSNRHIYTFCRDYLVIWRLLIRPIQIVVNIRRIGKVMFPVCPPPGRGVSQSQADGYPRTGVHPGRTGLGYPPTPQPVQDWGTAPHLRRAGQDWVPPSQLELAVCLGRFPAGGLSCCQVWTVLLITMQPILFCREDIHFWQQKYASKHVVVGNDEWDLTSWNKYLQLNCWQIV